MTNDCKISGIFMYIPPVVYWKWTNESIHPPFTSCFTRAFRLALRSLPSDPIFDQNWSVVEPSAIHFDGRDMRRLATKISGKYHWTSFKKKNKKQEPGGSSSLTIVIQTGWKVQRVWNMQSCGSAVKKIWNHQAIRARTELKRPQGMHDLFPVFWFSKQESSLRGFTKQPFEQLSHTPHATKKMCFAPHSTPS